MYAALEALPAEKPLGCDTVAARRRLEDEPVISPRVREILSMLNEIFDSLPTDGTVVDVADRSSFSP